MGIKARKFRFRSEPKKPKKKYITESLDLERYWTREDIIPIGEMGKWQKTTGADILKFILDAKDNFGVNPDEISFVDDSGWGECESHTIAFSRLETDEEFQPKLEEYKRKLKEYKKWKKENAAELEEYLRKKEEKKEKSKQAELKRKKAKIKKLEQELKKLEENS